MAAITIEEIKGLIPHRYPFLMIDKVVDIKEGVSIQAYKNISIGEEYFRGHFPDIAVFPGALTTEALAQAACVLFKKSMPDIGADLFYVTNIKMRFLKPVVPGDQLSLVVKTVKMTKIGGIFDAEASVGGEVVAKGEMTFACKETVKGD